MTILNDLNKKISNLEKNIQDETIQLKSYQTDMAILQGNFTQKIDELNQLFEQKDIPFKIVYDDKLRFIKLINKYDTLKIDTKFNPRTISSIHICSGQVDDWIEHQFKMIEFYEVITKMFSLLPENIKFSNTNNSFWDYKVAKDNFVFEFYLNENAVSVDEIIVKRILNDSLYGFKLALDPIKKQTLTFASGPYDYDLGRAESIPHTAFHAILSKQMKAVSIYDLTDRVIKAIKELNEKTEELRN